MQVVIFEATYQSMTSSLSLAQLVTTRQRYGQALVISHVASPAPHHLVAPPRKTPAHCYKLSGTCVLVLIV